MRMACTFAACALGFGLLLASSPAYAVPAFARQYGTSCETCHTVYPVLTPFGEAFRRNGYRFPGVNSESLRQEPTSLGQDVYRQMFPNSVWPANVPSGVPLAVGINGGAMFHPDTSSGAAAADNGSAFTLGDLAAELHLWAAGPIDDQITYFAEATASDEGIEFEMGSLQFSDIVGPKHMFNLWVGRMPATLQLYGPHGSYLSDHRWVSGSLTELYGADDGLWDVMGKHNGLEINGVVTWGRVQYALGIDAGSNIDVRNTQDVYAMVGFKLGGMRLDGEPGGAAPNAEHPWGETAFSLDLFAERSVSRFHTIDAMMLDANLDDRALTIGGSLRAQWDSLTLDAGARLENHTHALSDSSSAKMLVQWDELSYVALPWLVPALRFEYVQLTPTGGQKVSDYRIMPGVAALVRPNVKLALVGWFEGAQGAPDAGWGAIGGAASPATPLDVVGVENEGVAVDFAYAF